jgi:hypothetical protein
LAFQATLKLSDQLRAKPQLKNECAPNHRHSLLRPPRRTSRTTPIRFHHTHKFQWVFLTIPEGYLILLSLSFPIFLPSFQIQIMPSRTHFFSPQLLPIGRGDGHSVCGRPRPRS